VGQKTSGLNASNQNSCPTPFPGQRRLCTSLARSYAVWWLYHVVIADAVSLQKPTKDKHVYEFLGRDLGRVADIGCGPGVFTQYLCRHASQVYAADIDQRSLLRTFSRHASEANLAPIVTRVNELPFANSSLDTVLFLEVLEHLDDDLGALREINRVLVPSGRLIISVPVPPGEVNPGEEWGHKREGYSFRGLDALLRSANFKVARHAYAVFKYSRVAVRLVNSWRKHLHLPAPFFLGWPAYFDLLLEDGRRQQGDYQPADLIVLAEKRDPI
jgi:SAM-dependent methyltransferase